MSGTPAAPARSPAVFISHGSPTVVIEKGPFQERLAVAGRSMGGAKAIVVISAHWQRGVPVRVGRQERTQLIYDFGGFPEEMYRLTYP
ncbi:MAG: dioxygenase, partial [Myxococcaceae bacterium]